MKVKSIILVIILMISFVLTGCGESYKFHKEKDNLMKIFVEYDEFSRSLDSLKNKQEIVTGVTIQLHLDKKNAVESKIDSKLEELERLAENDNDLLKELGECKDTFHKKEQEVSLKLIKSAYENAKINFNKLQGLSTRVQDKINNIFLNDLNYQDQNRLNAYNELKKEIAHTSLAACKMLDIIDVVSQDDDAKEYLEQFAKIQSNSKEAISKIDKALTVQENYIKTSKYARDAAITEIKDNFNVAQVNDSYIIDRDNYGRYLVRVSVVGSNYFGVMVSKAYAVVVYDVSEKTYRHNTYFSHSELSDAYTLKLLNSWNKPIKTQDV